jgi:hypothetical protein
MTIKLGENSGTANYQGIQGINASEKFMDSLYI